MQTPDEPSSAVPVEAIVSVLTILIDDPVNNTVHHPFSAWNQGFEARELGYPAEVNPYPEGSERTWWNYGWIENGEDGGESDSTDRGGDNPEAMGGWRNNPTRTAACAGKTKPGITVL